MTTIQTRKNLVMPDMSEQTPRRQLIAAMGLRYDPLITSVSESDPAADFGEIYVDPQPSLLDMLRQAASALVFADYGMGKTATRLALEYTLRNSYEPSPPLCVTYTPRIDLLENGDAADILTRHQEAISREIAIDLIIQLIERQDSDPETLSAKQQAALRRQARALPLRLRHRIRDAAASGPSDGVIWHGIRPVARYVAMTPRWRGWIDRINSAFVPGAPQPVAWEQALEDTRTLGFPRVFLLIDAVDEGAINRDALQAVVAPLLNAIGRFQDQKMLLKCFLPTDLLELVRDTYQKRFQGLTVPVELATIAEVPRDHLEAIVNERLQAASASNASFRSLDWLKGSEITESIQARLAILARGSPRRMIELASALLDFHSEHGFRQKERLRLTAAEWQEFLARIERLSLASP